MKIEGRLESIDEHVLKLEGQDPVKHKFGDTILPVITPGVYVTYEENDKSYSFTWKTKDGKDAGVKGNL